MENLQCISDTLLNVSIQGKCKSVFKWLYDVWKIAYTDNILRKYDKYVLWNHHWRHVSRLALKFNFKIWFMYKHICLCSLVMWQGEQPLLGLVWTNWFDNRLGHIFYHQSTSRYRERDNSKVSLAYLKFILLDNCVWQGSILYSSNHFCRNPNPELVHDSHL